VKAGDPGEAASKVVPEDSGIISYGKMRAENPHPYSTCTATEDGRVV
jgi:hypothetical protein